MRVEILPSHSHNKPFCLRENRGQPERFFSFAPHEPKCFFYRKYAAMQGMIQNNVVILQHRFIPSIQNTRYGWGNLYVILNKIHKYNTEGRYYEQNELQRQYGRKKHKRGTDSHPHHRTRPSWTDSIHHGNPCKQGRQDSRHRPGRHPRHALARHSHTHTRGRVGTGDEGIALQGYGTGSEHRILAHHRR